MTYSLAAAVALELDLDRIAVFDAECGADADVGDDFDLARGIAVDFGDDDGAVDTPGDGDRVAARIAIERAVARVVDANAGRTLDADPDRRSAACTLLSGIGPGPQAAAPGKSRRTRM